MEGEEEKRKTSIELEMEKYLEEEFKCNQEFLEAGFQVEEMNSAPIDLSLPKVRLGPSKRTIFGPPPLLSVLYMTIFFSAN